MTLRLLTCSLLVLCLAVSSLPASVQAEPALVSGSYRVVVPSDFGTSSYTVTWSYPDSVQLGKSLNVTATLYVDGLTGVKLFVDTYILSAFVELPGQGFLGHGNVSSYYGCNRPRGCGSPYIYPGGHWGPENISVPITSLPGGTGSGDLTATVAIGFVTTVWYDAPVSQDYQDAGSQIVGNVTVTPQGTPAGGSLLSFVGFLAFGGVIGPALLYLFTRFSGRRPSPKTFPAG